MIAAERFKAIEGGRIVTKAKRKKGILASHRCAECSATLGVDYTALSKVTFSSVIRDGKVVGGTAMWCCARCNKPYYHA